ncbi:MAG: hypothetical protein WCE81_04200 [Halobacteriota archaeon]
MVLDDTYGADGSTLMKQHIPVLSYLRREEEMNAKRSINAG